MSNRNQIKKLASNTIVFGIGSFGTKVLQILIVPLYTFLLTTEEYGKIDLFTTTITLVIPFVTMLFHESIIRFLTAKEIQIEDAVSASFVVYLIAVVLSSIAALAYKGIFGNELSELFFLCLLLNAYNAIFQNYLKASDDVLGFAISGILNTIIFLLSNLIMLLWLRLGLNGYIYSILISQFTTALFVSFRGRIFRRFAFRRIRIELIKEMLFYSIPLIPNSLMWWLMNAGDKYIINYYLGDSANGLYSLSLKVATIVTTIFSIFMQAWQISAIEEYKKENQAEFYTDVYSNAMGVLFLTVGFLNVITRPTYSILISSEFFDAHLFSPLLCVATLINCMATFFGTTYLVNKNTKKAFLTTSIGAVINIIANLFLVKCLGLTGIALGTIVGYAVVIVIREIDTYKTIDMNLDLKRISSCIVVLLMSALLHSLNLGIVSLLAEIFAVVFIIAEYRRNLKEALRPLLRKFILRK